MNNKKIHNLSNRKHHPDSKQLRKQEIHRNDPAQNDLPWVKQLTSTFIDPQIMHHGLLTAGETLRNQTMYTLQRQNGNRYIQREALFPASIKGGSSLLEEPLLNKISTSPGVPAPIPSPYPNLSQITNPSTASNKVKLTDKSIFGMKSKIGRSSGDEAGTIKGMVSQKNGGPVFKVPSAPVINMQGPPISINPQPSQTAVQVGGATESTSFLDKLIATMSALQVSRAYDDTRVITHTLPEVGQQGGVVSKQLSSKIQRSLGHGIPLSGIKQAQMENTLGTSFSNVRLHTDSEADHISQQLSAKAFTLGSDIFFSRYANPHDDRLLSHELTHVVQQQHMSNRGPLTVGPADDQYEKQASSFADNSKSNAYNQSFAQQRNMQLHRETASSKTSFLDEVINSMPHEVNHQTNSSQSLDPAIEAQQTDLGKTILSNEEGENQVIQRELMDEFSLGNIAGIGALGGDILTGLSQKANLPLAKMLGTTAPNITRTLPGVSLIGKIAGPIGLITGAQDMMNSKKSWYDRLVGGLSAFGGATGTASTIASLFGSSAFSAGGASGLAAGASSALTGGGAGLLTGAGATTALGSLGAVAGAGAAGYGLGRILDEGFGSVANMVMGNAKEDRTLSGLGARGLSWLDKKISGLWRDPSKPAYTQTIGWKLANLLGI